MLVMVSRTAGGGASDGAAPVLVRVRRVDGEVPGGVVGHEAVPRWVWADTSAWYPRLLADGVRVERCLDLRLAHRVLRHSPATAGSRLATAPPGPFEAPTPTSVEASGTLADAADFGAGVPVADTLFADVPSTLGESELPPDEAGCLAELKAQDAAISSVGASAPGNGVARRSTDAAATRARLRLLLAAESAGALAAAEMHRAGVPWDPAAHDEILTRLLGPRPRTGERPARLAELAATIRAALDAPALNPERRAPRESWRS
ncbi:MAG: hypothetical protein FWF28_04445, partial [Micrococcales bacterium]|nr:hypothetical protein [Micrococcales bacterium]